MSIPRPVSSSHSRCTLVGCKSTARRSSCDTSVTTHCLFAGSGRTCNKDTGSEGDTLEGWRQWGCKHVQQGEGAGWATMQCWAKAELYDVEQWYKGAEQWRRISQVDSLGTVPYIWIGLYTYRFVHEPWSVRCTSLIIDGAITYHPIGCCASWETVERPWESPKMSGPVRGLELLTTGIIVPNKEWNRSSFLIRLYGFVPLHPLLLWTPVYPCRVIFDRSRFSDWSIPVQPLGVGHPPRGYRIL